MCFKLKDVVAMCNGQVYFVEKFIIAIVLNACSNNYLFLHILTVAAMNKKQEIYKWPPKVSGRK